MLTTGEAAPCEQSGDDNVGVDDDRRTRHDWARYPVGEVDQHLLGHVEAEMEATAMRDFSDRDALVPRPD